MAAESGRGTTARVTDMFEAKAAVGFPSEQLGRPESITLRRLAMDGRRDTSLQSVNASMKAFIDKDGHDISGSAAADILKRHVSQANESRSRGSYVAARRDLFERPERTLFEVGQAWGTKARPPGELDDFTAAQSHDPGHGYSQASTALPPGAHDALATSQHKDLNRGVQLSLERFANTLMQKPGRKVFVGMHHEYGVEETPEPKHTTFALFSSDESGNNVRLHTHLRVNNR